MRSKRFNQKVKSVTDEDFKRLNVYAELTKEKMLSDVLSHLFQREAHEISTRLFENTLDIDCDMYFGTISKEQLISIIHTIRHSYIIPHLFSHYIVINGIQGEDRKQLLQQDPEALQDYFNNLEETQKQWNHKTRTWMGSWKTETGSVSYPHLNLDPENKWEISGSSSYEYMIFDLIHILKTFDFEHNTIVAIGS